MFLTQRFREQARSHRLFIVLDSVQFPFPALVRLTPQKHFNYRSIRCKGISMSHVRFRFALCPLALALLSISANAAEKIDPTLQLGATNISAQGLGATTEGTGSYTTGATTTATKLPLTMRETPQSVTVVTRQLMDDHGSRHR
jgi:outer membrane receptor for ferric coprogen and ferric-rhodotorulic acid